MFYLCRTETYQTQYTFMKRILLTVAALVVALGALAQPKLTKDNIEDVIKAMTVQEKATLLVGGARAAMVNGVTSGTAWQVPGAAGNTRPIERLGIPGTVLADGPAGLRIQPTRQGDSNTYYCTGFPVGTLLASSWDIALVEDMTKAMGNEVLEYGVDVLLAPGMKTCLEAKLFGIGLESYTVGSHDFVAGYCATRKLMYTLDTGHYEMTENVADMVASLLLFVPELMLHVSRPIRWDSDHVTIMNDQTLDLFKEIVRADALNRSHIGLDYFDAAINRIGAYVIGTRATQKCVLSALLEPLAKLREYEDAGKGFQRLALLEEAKTLPFGAVFDYFNYKNGVPVGEEFIPCIEQYEKDVTSKR